jgi:hypothetical protein
VTAFWFYVAALCAQGRVLNPVNSGYAVGIGGHIAFMPKCVPSLSLTHPLPREAVRAALTPRAALQDAREQSGAQSGRAAILRNPHGTPHGCLRLSCRSYVCVASGSLTAASRRVSGWGWGLQRNDKTRNLVVAMPNVQLFTKANYAQRAPAKPAGGWANYLKTIQGRDKAPADGGGGGGGDTKGQE